jgi:hypothetical protein
VTGQRAVQHVREVAAAKLVARWFGTNVAQVESFTVEQYVNPAGVTSYTATATLVTPLTPEEFALYRSVMEPEL